MSSTGEALLFWRYIGSSLDRLVALSEGLDDATLNWRPEAPGVNSLGVLITHTLANAEENLLSTLGGQRYDRDHPAEFAAQPTAAELQTHWRELRPRLAACLTALPPSALRAIYQHPRRGTVSGRDILIVVARHAAEHLGQAELTRDLLRAAQGET